MDISLDCQECLQFQVESQAHHQGCEKQGWRFFLPTREPSFIQKTGVFNIFSKSFYFIFFNLGKCGRAHKPPHQAPKGRTTCQNKDALKSAIKIQQYYVNEKAEQPAQTKTCWRAQKQYSFVVCRTTYPNKDFVICRTTCQNKEALQSAEKILFLCKRRNNLPKQRRAEQRDNHIF